MKISTRILVGPQNGLAVDDDGEDEERLDALREPHRRIGIETRVLRQSSLDFLPQTDLVDFILFDRAASYELHSWSRAGWPSAGSTSSPCGTRPARNDGRHRKASPLID